MRTPAIVATALVLGMTVACSTVERNGSAIVHGVDDAVIGAAHDHVTVQLPHVRSPVDLGDLRRNTLTAMQEQLRGIFGDDPKDTVDQACRAKDLLEAQAAEGTTEQIRTALDALGISAPEQDMRQLEELTRRTLDGATSPNELTRLAVAWACKWAASP